MRFVLGTQPLEHLDGDRGIRLLDEDGLETALQRGVFLYVRAVLVLGGRSQRLKLSPG